MYAVAYATNGKRFASGGADKTVIIWTSKVTAEAAVSTCLALKLQWGIHQGLAAWANALFAAVCLTGMSACHDE